MGGCVYVYQVIFQDINFTSQETHPSTRLAACLPGWLTDWPTTTTTTPSTTNGWQINNYNETKDRMINKNDAHQPLSKLLSKANLSSFSHSLAHNWTMATARTNWTEMKLLVRLVVASFPFPFRSFPSSKTKDGWMYRLLSSTSERLNICIFVCQGISKDTETGNEERRVRLDAARAERD